LTGNKSNQVIKISEKAPKDKYIIEEQILDIKGERNLKKELKLHNFIILLLIRIDI
jgi:hypothetical protein